MCNTKYYALANDLFHIILNSERLYAQHIRQEPQTQAKTFATIQQAENWLEQQVPLTFTTKNKIIIYLTASFKGNMGKYSIVAYKVNELHPVQQFTGTINYPAFHELKQYGAEMIATLEALNWAAANQFTHVDIVYTIDSAMARGLHLPANHAMDIYHYHIKNFLKNMVIHYIFMLDSTNVLP